MTHRNPPLTPEGRLRPVRRCASRPIAHVAAEAGVFRPESRGESRLLARRPHSSTGQAQLTEPGHQVIRLLLGFVSGHGFGGVGSDVLDPAIDEGEEALDASIGQLAQEDVGSLADQDVFGIEARDAESLQDTAHPAPARRVISDAHCLHGRHSGSVPQPLPHFRSVAIKGVVE